MPLVHVYWNDSVIRDSDVRPIKTALPELVSKTLSVSSGSSFPPSHVTVKGFEMTKLLPEHELQERDFFQEPMSSDVEVVIWAHNYPERVARIDELAATLSDAIKPLVPKGCNGHVLILLQPIGLASFPRGKRS